MEEPISPLQAWVDGMSRAWAAERAESQMTLGELIEALGGLRSDVSVTGFGELWSYRGYYEDLAFGASGEAETAENLLRRCRECMGQVFEGWKGGRFPMHANTALWIASEPRALGERVMGLDFEADPICPVTEPEEF